MQRLAFKMKLNRGQKEVYKNRHDELWPELKVLLKANGVSEYSIFLDEETSTLFAFQKVSGEGGSQDLASNDIVKKWWDFMADIMEVNPDNSPVSIPLEELFYMEQVLFKDFTERAGHYKLIFDLFLRRCEKEKENHE